VLEKSFITKANVNNESKNVNNLKKTWDLIRSATNCKNVKSKEQLSQLLVDGNLFTNPFLMACKLNEHFTTTPSNIAAEIPPCEDLEEIPNDNANVNVPLLSFTDSPVTGSEVLDAISELLPKKSEDFNGVPLCFLPNNLNSTYLILFSI